MARLPQLHGALRSGLLRSEAGSAAFELALWLGVITLPLLNAVDLGMYAYQRMQVEQAAQMATQAAFNLCSQGAASTPLLTKCLGLVAATAGGAQSTALGSNVTVTGRSEGDYCVDASGALVTAGCSGANTGHYLLVSVQYTYRPLFPYASVTSLLSALITRTHYMRMS